MYFCSGQIYFKELKIKLNLLNLKHGVQKSNSEAYSLKKCTLPYANFVFKCLVIFWNQRRGLEKKFDCFLIGSEHP